MWVHRPTVNIKSVITALTALSVIICPNGTSLAAEFILPNSTITVFIPIVLDGAFCLGELTEYFFHWFSYL
jgi:hypothetical protein